MIIKTIKFIRDLISFIKSIALARGLRYRREHSVKYRRKYLYKSHAYQDDLKPMLHLASVLKYVSMSILGIRIM